MCFAYTGVTVNGHSRQKARGSRNNEALSFGPEVDDEEEEEEEEDDSQEGRSSTAAAGNNENHGDREAVEASWQASGLSSGTWDSAPVCATVLVSRSAGRYRVQVCTGGEMK